MANPSGSILAESPVKSFRADGLSQPEFTWLLRYVDITTQQYACLCALNARRPTIEPSEQRLAKDMKCSVSQVKKLLKGFRAEGWLKVLRQGSNLTHKATLYDLLVPVSAAQAANAWYLSHPDERSTGFEGWYLRNTRLVSDVAPKSTRETTKSSSYSSLLSTTNRAGIPGIPAIKEETEEKDLASYSPLDEEEDSGVGLPRRFEPSVSEVSRQHVGSYPRNTSPTTVDYPKDIHMWQRRNSRMMRVDDGSPQRHNEIDGGWIDDDYLWMLKEEREIYS